MTTQEVDLMIEEETTKLKALKAIVTILESLPEDAREWVIEKVTE